MPAHDPFAPSSAVKLDRGDTPVADEPVADEPVEENAGADDSGDDALEVPKGTVRELEEWVGDDKERAQAVIDSENENAEPRKTLVAAMEALLEQE